MPLLLNGGDSRSYGWRGSASDNLRPALGERRTMEVCYKKRRIAVDLSAEEIAPVTIQPGR